MTQRLIRLTIFIGVLATILYLNREALFGHKIDSVRAFGDLQIDFHVPIGNPIFVINNLAPGQFETRNVDATNSGTLTRLVSIKGLRTGPDGQSDPKLETELDIVISDGIAPLYGQESPTGPKKLSAFFTESGTTNGILLNAISPGGTKTYSIKVTFPSSADNLFQNKSVIFDLTFGYVTSSTLVINEVFYNVDSSHGLDSPKDRGILGVNGNNVNINISGNGPGSKNIVKVNQTQACKILQSNFTNIVGFVNVNAQTGNINTKKNNGIVNITTGNASASATFIAMGGVNTANCGKMLGQNDESVELFNPTNQDISLKNWTLTDNSGTPRKINANKIIKAGGFALLSKSASTWNVWNENPQAIKVELGSDIGDGLDNAGDRLILKDPNGTISDQISWGTDSTILNPAIAAVIDGHSSERNAPGLDTDVAGDFHDQNPPTPGN